MSNHYETGENFFDSIFPERKARKQRVLEFWEKQTFKIYVCTLSDSRKGGRIKPETRYVRIREWKITPEVERRVRLAAWRQSVDFARVSQVAISIRLADPELDLECVWTGTSPNPITLPDEVKHDS